MSTMGVGGPEERSLNLSGSLPWGARGEQSSLLGNALCAGGEDSQGWGSTQGQPSP